MTIEATLTTKDALTLRPLSIPSRRIGERISAIPNTVRRIKKVGEKLANSYGFAYVTASQTLAGLQYQAGIEATQVGIENGSVVEVLHNLDQVDVQDIIITGGASSLFGAALSVALYRKMCEWKGKDRNVGVEIGIATIGAKVMFGAMNLLDYAIENIDEAI